MLIWVRAEGRKNEQRVALMPEGAAQLIAAGYDIVVEDDPTRAVPIEEYRQAKCRIVPAMTWPDAPQDAVILGLKELPDDGSPLRHRHIMFGHAYKGQTAGRILLDRFSAGGGTLLDLEYLTDESGRRVAAFGYWAGFAGAAISLMTWAGYDGPAQVYASANALAESVRAHLSHRAPSVLIIGALGRVGTGAAALCDAAGARVTGWDMAETAHGGPFPEILTHEVFLNCILAAPDVPVFVPRSALDAPRSLRVIGDIACDPDSDFNPIPLYHEATNWASPTVRVHKTPPLDIMAIDNLPSMLPQESSQDFAGQLLPHLMDLKTPNAPIWARAEMLFKSHLGE